MLGWIRAMSRIALINASDRSCPFLGDILPISRNTLCSQFQPFPYRPTPAFLPLVAQTFRIVSVIGEKGEELERKVCLARKLLFSCYRRSIPSKELGVGMYMERKKREKAICFIVEKIILPVDRSNLVDLVTRISRDLKYSFNEILVDASWGIERRGITRSFFRYSNPEPVSHLNFPSSIIFCVRSEKVSALARIPDIEKQSRTYVTIRMKRG